MSKKDQSIQVDRPPSLYPGEYQDYQYRSGPEPTPQSETPDDEATPSDKTQFQSDRESRRDQPVYKRPMDIGMTSKPTVTDSVPAIVDIQKSVLFFSRADPIPNQRRDDFLDTDLHDVVSHRTPEDPNRKQYVAESQKYVRNFIWRWFLGTIVVVFASCDMINASM